MASAVNRNQPVARNLDSLFEAHGNEPHVASHVDDNVQPTSVATPGRMGQRYPSSPFGISGSVLANASVTEPTTTALRDYDARPNRLLASDMVERMEALREQLMRVSSTLSGVQERAASLTAALERSRKSLAQEADSAPRSHMPAAAMPTPSTQPRGAVRASPCGNVGMPPAAASPLPVAAARADAGVEPKAHVFTVTVTTATSPDVSRLPVASSSSRDAGWEEGAPPPAQQPHPFELDSPSGTTAYVELPRAPEESKADGKAETEPQCSAHHADDASGDVSTRSGIRDAAAPMAEEEERKDGISDAGEAFPGPLGTLRRGVVPAAEASHGVGGDARARSAPAAVAAAAAAAGVAAVTLSSAFTQQLDCPVMQELMQRPQPEPGSGLGPAAGPDAAPGCRLTRGAAAAAASSPSKSLQAPPPAFVSGSLGAAADPHHGAAGAGLLPLLTAAEGSLELMRAERRLTLHGSGGSELPSDGSSRLLLSPTVMLTFDSEAGAGAATVVPVTEEVYAASAPAATAAAHLGADTGEGGAEAHGEAASPTVSAEPSSGVHSPSYAFAERRASGSGGGGVGGADGQSRSASFSDAEDNWLRRVNMDEVAEEEGEQGAEAQAEERVDDGAGYSAHVMGGAAGARGSAARPRSAGSAGGGGRRYYDGYSEEDGDADVRMSEASEDGSRRPLSAPAAAARRAHANSGAADAAGDFSFPSPSTSLAGESGERPTSAGSGAGVFLGGTSSLRWSVSLDVAARSGGGGSARSSVSGGADSPAPSVPFVAALGTPDSGAAAVSSSLRPGWCRIVVPSSPRSSTGGWSVPSPVPSPYTYGVIGVRTPSSGGAAPFSLRKHLDLTVSSCLFGGSDSDSDSDSEMGRAGAEMGAAAGAGTGAIPRDANEVEEGVEEEIEERIEQGDDDGAGLGWPVAVEEEESTGSCGAVEASQE